MAGKRGQRTINLYAFFFSLVAFLFVVQLGTFLLGWVMGFRYPQNMTSVVGFFRVFPVAILLTMIFLLASQAGVVVIRRAEADLKITALYNRIVLFIMVLSMIYVWMAYRNPFFLIPNVLTIAAIVYSLTHMDKSRGEIIRSTKAWRAEQARRERKAMRAKMKQ